MRELSALLGPRGPRGLLFRSGIVTNTFLLARGHALVEFVKQAAQICRGKAYFTNTMTIGQFILMNFPKRRTTRM